MNKNIVLSDNIMLFTESEDSEDEEISVFLCKWFNSVPIKKIFKKCLLVN